MYLYVIHNYAIQGPEALVRVEREIFADKQTQCRLHAMLDRGCRHTYIGTTVASTKRSA